MKKNKIYVIGDIHGNFKGLKQAIERSPIDLKNDTLISVGDVVDGYPESYDCIEFLRKIPNLIAIRGNHDKWIYDFILGGDIHNYLWLSQGGYNTLKSYGYEFTHGALSEVGEIPYSHKRFFMRQIPFWAVGSTIITHGGLNRHKEMKDQEDYVLMWDRDLWMASLSSNVRNEEDKKKYPFKLPKDVEEVVVGHTTTMQWGTDEPIFADRVINIDTGGGYNGRITVMDLETKEYWQSDTGIELYGKNFGR